jgi:O-antigen biosynthesis protein
MELTVVIVSYNVCPFLEQCLLSVRKASENIGCEVFVVDNNSTDRSCSMIKNSFPEVTLIVNDSNMGFARANNQAIRMAKGKFILLLNPDTIIEENTFSKCIEFMNSHPDAGSVGVKMIDGKGRYLRESKRAIPTPEVAFFKIFGFSSIFPESPKFNKYYMGFLDDKETNKIEILTGAFMFIRKKTLEKVGLLDESFFMYGEDIDLSYRIIKSGYFNYYLPEVKIIHFKGQSTSKGKVNYVINFYSAMLIFMSKHFAMKGKGIYLTMLKSAVFLRAIFSLLKRIPGTIIQPLKIENIFKREGSTIILTGKNDDKTFLKEIAINYPEYKITGEILLPETDKELSCSITQIKEKIRKDHIRNIIFNSGKLEVSLIIKIMTEIQKENICMRFGTSSSESLIGIGSTKSDLVCYSF